MTAKYLETEIMLSPLHQDKMNQIPPKKPSTPPPRPPHPPPAPNGVDPDLWEGLIFLLVETTVINAWTLAHVALTYIKLPNTVLCTGPKRDPPPDPGLKAHETKHIHTFEFLGPEKPPPEGNGSGKLSL